MGPKTACGGSCGQSSCGCSAKDPYEESLRVVWHEPTEYSMPKHGPSYLPSKMSSTQRTKVKAAMQRTAAYYDAPGVPWKAGVKESHKTFSVLLAVMKAAASIHQTHHWQTKGLNFYADHLLFERLYNESLDLIDQIAERAVGTGGPELVAAEKQAELVHKAIEFVYATSPTAETGSTMAGLSLFAEGGVVFVVGLLLEELEESGDLTPGTSNLLEGIADKHESFAYLLQQRAELPTQQGYTYDHS